MRHSVTLLASAVILATALIGPAFSQGAPQTVTLMKVDPQTLATGYRASKLVGSTVVNEADETVGTIDDLIVHLVDRHRMPCCRSAVSSASARNTLWCLFRHCK